MVNRIVRSQFTGLLGIFFVSGFAALVYQVLWVRELGLLFGSTAQAAALAIAVFFAGIALGAWFWGRRAAGAPNSLILFALLEVGVAVTALGHFVLLDLYHWLYPSLHGLAGAAGIADTLIKVLVATLVLLPPAFFMGGTLPAMGQYLVRGRQALARTGSALYALNTAGSACGALAAGFVLPMALGFRGTYLLAVGLDLAVALAAFVIARSASPWQEPSPVHGVRDTAPAPGERGGELGHERSVPASLLMAIAFFSGLTTLAVEVVWTRLFAQVLQNSVYTYSLVLVAFLGALSLGAGLANGLCRLRRPGMEVMLAGLLLISGLLVLVSPWLFLYLTDGGSYIGSGRDWWPYLFSVTAVSIVVMVLPAMVPGAVLPYLLRGMEASGRSAGGAIGTLVAVNTVGGIVGSLFAGFVLLPLAGAAGSLALCALVYPLLALVLLPRVPGPVGLAAAPVCLALFVIAVLSAGVLDTVRVDESAGERLVDSEEGAHASAAVVERDGHLLLRVNNHYILGGTGALESERNQGRIPLLLHPQPREVFFLGMGTGISAGAAMPFPVEKVVICEILPEVITLASRRFGPWTQGLFTDDRVEIHAEDGRNCLQRNPDKSYDLIISDLFTPWKAGTGNLYTREHYATGRDRLREGGQYVQWVPAYQVSESEFAIIAATMIEVFDQVLLWRGDLLPDQSIIALVGQKGARPLDPQVPIRGGRMLAGNSGLSEEVLAASALRFYAGNLTASGLFRDTTVNTDNYPVIEYMAPRTQRRVRAGEEEWVAGAGLGLLYEELIRNPGPDQDPYLVQLSAQQRDYVLAGRSYYHYQLLSRLGRKEQADAFLNGFIRRTPFDELPERPSSPETLSGWEE